MVSNTSSNLAFHECGDLGGQEIFFTDPQKKKKKIRT